MDSYKYKKSGPDPVKVLFIGIIGAAILFILGIMLLSFVRGISESNSKTAENEALAQSLRVTALYLERQQAQQLVPQQVIIIATPTRDSTPQPTAVSTAIPPNTLTPTSTPTNVPTNTPIPTRTATNTPTSTPTPTKAPEYSVNLSYDLSMHYIKGGDDLSWNIDRDLGELAPTFEELNFNGFCVASGYGLIFRSPKHITYHVKFDGNNVSWDDEGNPIAVSVKITVVNDIKDDTDIVKCKSSGTSLKSEIHTLSLTQSAGCDFAFTHIDFTEELDTHQATLKNLRICFNKIN